MLLAWRLIHESRSTTWAGLVEKGRIGDHVADADRDDVPLDPRLARHHLRGGPSFGVTARTRPRNRSAFAEASSGKNNIMRAATAMSHGFFGGLRITLVQVSPLPLRRLGERRCPYTRETCALQRALPF